MKLISILKKIYNHPCNSNYKIRAMKRFLSFQISTRLTPFPIISPFTKNSKLIIKRGMIGITGNYYNGLADFYDMGFLLHFLKPDDLFVDIGANLGVYSILASAEIGANAIAIEPVPVTFNGLMENISLNQIQQKVNCLNICLGNKTGTITFTKSFDVQNHVATEKDKKDIDTIEVEISTLDSLLTTKPCPSLIKIDVEGFETEVLLGAKNTISNKNLKAIIIELNGSGIRYGYEDTKIHETLLKYGFEPYHYNPESRELHKLDSYNDQFNTIYLRDIFNVRNRVSKSKKITIVNNLKQY